MYLIDLIQIEFTPEQIARIKTICVQHIKLFNNKLGPEPVALPVWTTRAGSRMESIQKPRSAPTNINMLEQGIIVKSEASYYSQVTLASKPDGSYRFFIDYSHLNDATESASWPIPYIKQMLARLGSQEADTFGVIDLTAGYHQAPLTLSTLVYTAFITFMGISHFT